MKPEVCDNRCWSNEVHSLTCWKITSKDKINILVLVKSIYFLVMSGIYWIENCFSRFKDFNSFVNMSLVAC